MPFEYVEVDIYKPDPGGWKILEGTRRMPGDTVKEVFPDHKMRYRRLRRNWTRRSDRDGRWDRGYRGDLERLKNLKERFQHDRWIPVGDLLDVMEQFGEKRQPCHAALRRLWRKGLVRRLEEAMYGKFGVWYMLSEWEAWSVSTDRAINTDTSRRILNDLF